MSLFICPICKCELIDSQKTLYCKNNHSFDKAKNGYVNLLLPNQKKSNTPGDNMLMIQARKKALEKGYYSALAQFLSVIFDKYTPSITLDLGCGEGTLTQILAEHSKTCIGIDISKSAISQAKIKAENVSFAVASAVELPIRDNSIDLILNCFAPLYTGGALKVLKQNGVIVKVTPAEDHLWQLKQAIYTKPYLNPPEKQYSDLDIVSSDIVECEVELNGDYLQNVLTMTPYFYKTPKGSIDKVLSSSIVTKLAFMVKVLKPKQS